ncbi:MAG: tRNA lysidine(34) synthetase TilS [Phycisphaerae bacterium]
MPTPRGLVQRLDQLLHQQTWLPPKARLLVACSGGADSMALLHLLCAVNQSQHWQWRLVVGHVEHGQRGRHSVTDAKFVQRVARELGLKYVEKRLRLPTGSSENILRAARRQALGQLARSSRCARVVMAHHGDDQAETVLMRLMRGTGLRGLGAMRPVTRMGKVTLVRPLLGQTRAELRAWLTAQGHTWREDASNLSPRYLRNRVRADLVPMLMEMNPQLVPALGRLAQHCREGHAVVQRRAQAYLAKYPPRWRGRGWVCVGPLARQLPAVRKWVLRLLLKKTGLGEDQVDSGQIAQVERALQRGGKATQVQFAQGRMMAVQGETLRVGVQRRKSSARAGG